MMLFLVVLAAVLPLVAVTEWPIATPESAGIPPSRMQALVRTLAEHNTRALLVARHGRIVFEWYAADSGPGRKQGTASLAKALVGGLPLLVALSDGRINLDDPAAK